MKNNNKKTYCVQYLLSVILKSKRKREPLNAITDLNIAHKYFNLSS